MRKAAAEAKAGAAADAERVRRAVAEANARWAADVDKERQAAVEANARADEAESNSGRLKIALRLTQSECARLHGEFERAKADLAGARTLSTMQSNIGSKAEDAARKSATFIQRLYRGRHAAMRAGSHRLPHRPCPCLLRDRWC